MQKIDKISKFHEMDVENQDQEPDIVFCEKRPFSRDSARFFKGLSQLPFEHLKAGRHQPCAQQDSPGNLPGEKQPRTQGCDDNQNPVCPLDTLEELFIFKKFPQCASAGS